MYSHGLKMNDLCCNENRKKECLHNEECNNCICKTCNDEDCVKYSYQIYPHPYEAYCVGRVNKCNQHRDWIKEMFPV